MSHDFSFPAPRSVRRHHVFRLKKARFQDWHMASVAPGDPGFNRLLGMHVSTPKRCACWMCKNPRRSTKEWETQQEKRARLAWVEGLVQAGEGGL